VALTQAERDNLKVGDYLKLEEWGAPGEYAPSYIARVVYRRDDSIALDDGTGYELDNPYLSIPTDVEVDDSVSSSSQGVKRYSNRCG
jgi:hypothetical protein